MAYDEGLVARMRDILADRPDVEEKKMFGGIGYFVGGNYACGASMELVVRVGPDFYQEALAQPFVRMMDITGRPMKGWVFVGHEALESDADLSRWMGYGLAFAGKLPPK